MVSSSATIGDRGFAAPATPHRMVLGWLLIVPVLAAVAAVAWACLWLLIAAQAIHAVLTLDLFRRPRTVALLESVPALAPLYAILAAMFESPAAFAFSVRKILRELQGYRIGWTPAPPGAASDTAVYVHTVVHVEDADFVVRIRGEDLRNPPVLYCHGGPGMTELFAGGGQVFRRELEKHFVVVDFDQRTACSSAFLNLQHAPGGRRAADAFRRDLAVHQHVRDAAAIADFICTTGAGGTLPKPPGGRIFLTGGSWGSVLATRTAALRPDLFHGPVIVRGLVTDQVASERIGFDDIKQTMELLLADDRTTCATKKRIEADAALLDELQGIPAGSFDYSGPDGVEQMLFQRKILAAYGGDRYAYRVAVRERDLAPIPAWRRMYGMVQEGWNAPEIPIGAILNAKANVEDTIKRLSHMWSTGFNPLPPRLNVSLLVAQGRHDYCTASPLVEGHLKKNLAVGPGCTKRVCWFEESGHAPCKEEPIEFARLLTQEWRPAVSATACRYKPFEV